MIFFNQLDPSSVDPELLVDREQECAWLEGSLKQYLGNDNPDNGRAYCITGGKGVGKSILTHKVLDRLRNLHAATTMFISVDCRRCQNRRTVVARVAQAVIKELDRLPSVPRELISTAHVLATVANFDSAKLSVVHQHLVQHRSAIKLAGQRALLDFLGLNFEISLERSDKKIKELAGEVRFDEHRLIGALIELLRDVRAQRFHIVVYLDNIDELDHASYRSVEQRDAVRVESEGLLELKAAPIALILNMRTYYTDVLPRSISKVRLLEPLEAKYLAALLDRRLAQESEKTRKALSANACRATIDRLASMASTPLSFLTWFEFLCEQGAPTPERLSNDLALFARTRFATLPRAVLRAVAGAFSERDAMISRAQLLKACGDNEAVFTQVQQHQVVLPVDFWSPNEFTLDPLLHFMLAARDEPG